MVSFIISYTSTILSIRVQPKSQPFSTLSPRFFGLSCELSSSFSLLVFVSPLSFSPFLSFFFFSSLFSLRPISIEKCVSQIEVFYKCAASSVVYSQFLSRTINRKLAHAVVKRQNVRLFKDFLRGNKNWTGEREGEDEKSLETGRRQARYTRKSEEARERKRENGRTYNFPDCLTPLPANNASEKFSRECAITDFFCLIIV